MIQKTLISAIMLIGALNLHAIEITRYVRPAATGDGTTPENPSGNLGSMLALSDKVDKLTLFVAPGFYSINLPDYDLNFRNVELDGSWEAETSTEKVHIHHPGVGFHNSKLYNVSFSGGVQLNGGTMIDCEAEKQITMTVANGDVDLISCKAANFRAENWASAQGRKIFMFDCSTSGKGGTGFFAKSISRIKAIECKFNNCSQAGIDLDNCNSVEFSDCEFCFNSGDGAVRLISFDNSATALFSRCQFIANDVTNNRQYNVHVYSNVTFTDCLFAANREKDSARKGFIHLSRPDFLIRNCTFVDNFGALELESYYPDRYQIINCAFWNNGSTVVHSDAGTNIPLLCCAMDHGTGIPELDAEKGITMLTEANKGFRFNGATIDIEPGSVLINRGAYRPLDSHDLYRHPRNTFGATDIGCVEFISTPGFWKADTTTVATAEGNYRLFTSNVNDTPYYLLGPETAAASADIHFNEYDWDIIYLDKMPVAPKAHTLNNGTTIIERHLNVPGQTSMISNLAKRNSATRQWYTYGSYEYDTPKQRPTVKITPSGAEFVKPATTPARKTGTSTRKTTSTKRTATKRR